MDKEPHAASGRATLPGQHRVEALRRLAAGIAHEFANALTAIGGIAYLMQSGGTVDKQSEADLDEIRKITEEAAFLARELMAFGTTEVDEPSRRRLGELVKQLRRVLPHVLPPHIRIVERMGAPDAEVWADPQQLNEIAIVLAVDACERMPGGGDLLLATRREEFDGAAAAAVAMRPGRYGVVEITSSRSAAGARNSTPQSPDLLADANRMLSAAGGGLTVRDDAKGNRTFAMCLPLAVESGDVTGPPRGGATGSETILLVEDDEDLAEVVARMLQTRGYRVLRAADGDAALAVAETHGAPIHLLLSDVMIPGTTGLDLLRRFTAVQPAGRALFVSGYEHGFTEEVPFLRKPFEADALSRKVREVLDEDKRG